MSIQDFREKLNLFLADDTAFFGVLIVLVGLSSFGLGRLSVMPNAPKQPAAITMSQVAVREAPETVEENPPSSTESQYVGSKNSDKYHASWCPGAARIKEENKIWFATEAAAQAAGYAPAGNCEGL